MKNIHILGAGMAGYGAASRFKEAGINFDLFEKEDHFGGHCASYTFDDKWTFDDGPHISFTKNDFVKDLFAKNINNEYYEFSANVDNFWKGKWIKHPAQINLHGLPASFNTQILNEMIALKDQKSQIIQNYKEWLYASYGKTFSENFPMKYTRKFHTTEAENLSTDWLGPRLYQPNIEEVIFGMLSPTTPDVHYIKGFRYPNKGGFVSFMNGIRDIENINYKHELVSINLKEKKLQFSNGKSENYNYCFSSMPLNKVVEIMEDAPKKIREASEKLAWTQCVLVNFGIRRTDISPSHWRYVYDEDFYSTRISFPSMFGPSNAPEGCSSVQVEIYFSDKYKPLIKKAEDFIPIIKDELIQMGILMPNDDILFQNAWVTPYAQIIFDHDRKQAVETIHEFLLENNIHFGGRYADWGYIWSDESYIRGREEAEKVINKLNPTSVEI